MTDERDLRDPTLDAAWRAQSTEMPPPALDAAILAAAHRAAKSAPEKIGPGREATRPWRWWTPLAAAAVIGVIAIGALQLMPHEPDPTKVVVSDVPSTDALKPEMTVAPPPPPPAAPSVRASPPASALAPSATPPAAVPPSTSPPPAPRQERRMAEAPRARSPDTAEREPKLAAPAPAAPQPFPARRDAAAVPAPAAESSATGRTALTDNAMPAAPLPRAAPAAPPASAAGGIAPMLAKRATRDEAQRQRSPDDFVARIRKLFAEANMAEAQRELVAFRAAYADADTRLPADLRPWAASVPRN